MENLSLTAMGWSDFFQSQLNSISLPDYRLGRVITENRTNYGVRTESGEFIAGMTGRLMYSALTDSDLPKVGDWVVITLMDEDRAIIHEVLARKTVLARKAPGKNMTGQVIATNLDVLFIVQGLDDNFNLARLERYVAAAHHINSVIVLNKSDLCSDVDEKIAAVRNRIPGVDVIATSSLRLQTGALQAYLQTGKTFAFAGSSGVGKSSLINNLLNADRLKVTPVRENDSRGRHTTTRREMIFLDSGAILIDTPGMREFQPWAEEENISSAFADIQELSSQCRFADCQHIHETGCAVKEAIESGRISAAHYQNFLKLKREIAWQQSLTDVNKAMERKRSFKQQIKTYNKIVRRKRNED